jgi:transcriptional regulator with XRE-family HTH domain
MTTTEKAMRARLQQITRDHSQAEIARKTGVPANNISRYLKDARIPANFVTRLAVELGVNPVWLHVGDGAPYLTDVAGQTMKMAGDVLELVQAMNAVVQMRLGALTGKHHLRVLRELNDALLRYEALREKLNANSAPIFGRLLDDLERALRTYDLDRAADLRKAAQQVERLCDEPELSRRFVALQAHIETLNLNAAESIRLQQQLIREPLTEGHLATPEQCEEVLRLSLTLSDNNRLLDALRVCNAFMELADDAAREWPGMPDLRFQRASLLVDLGRVREGLAEMQNWSTLVSKRRAVPTRAVVGRALMLSGLLRLEEGFGFADDSELKFQHLIEIACWLEEPALLTRAMDATRGESTVLPGFLPQVELGECLLSALENRDRKAAARFAKRYADNTRTSADTFTVNLSCAQIALAAGDRKTAVRYHAKACSQLADRATADNTPVMFKALHARNALRLDQQNSAARATLEALVNAGYELFRMPA